MTIKLRLLLWYLNVFSKDDLSVSPAKIREENAKTLPRMLKLVDYSPIKLAAIKDEQIEMRDGKKNRVRIYHPSQEKNLPLIVYFHGGGFVVRTIESHDLICRRLCRDNQAIVISVDYRLAPEYKFPIPHQDCYDATVWAAENALKLGANTDQLTVMGDSAGGNLATIVSILARDNRGPAIKNQVLIYPTVDARLNHPSIDKFGSGYFLSLPRMHWYRDQYINKKEDVLNPLMSPLLTADLSNLPPAFVCTAAYDPLKDEGEAYAIRLKEEGNQVVFKEFPNVIHGFFNMPKLFKECLEAHRNIQSFLK